jgi:hypothetical protein
VKIKNKIGKFCHIFPVFGGKVPNFEKKKRKVFDILSPHFYLDFRGGAFFVLAF